MLDTTKIKPTTYPIQKKVVSCDGVYVAYRRAQLTRSERSRRVIEQKAKHYKCDWFVGDENHG